MQLILSTWLHPYASGSSQKLQKIDISILFPRQLWWQQDWRHREKYQCIRASNLPLFGLSNFSSLWMIWEGILRTSFSVFVVGECQARSGCLIIPCIIQRIGKMIRGHHMQLNMYVCKTKTAIFICHFGNEILNIPVFAWGTSSQLLCDQGRVSLNTLGADLSKYCLGFWLLSIFLAFSLPTQPWSCTKVLIVTLFPSVSTCISCVQLESAVCLLRLHAFHQLFSVP